MYYNIHVMEKQNDYKNVFELLDIAYSENASEEEVEKSIEQLDKLFNEIFGRRYDYD